MYKVCAKTWLEKDGKSILSSGRVRLLKQIERPFPGIAGLEDILLLGHHRYRYQPAELGAVSRVAGGVGDADIVAVLNQDGSLVGADRDRIDGHLANVAAVGEQRRVWQNCKDSAGNNKSDNSTDGHMRPPVILRYCMNCNSRTSSM